MIFPNIGERPLDKTSVPNNFKSFSKQVDQKKFTQNINKKKHQNNYFRDELGQKQDDILSLKEKRNRLTFNYMESLRFFNIQSL